MNGKDYIRLPHIKDEIRSRFNYDPDLGSLTWAYRDESNKQNVYFNKYIAGKLAGSVNVHYKCGYKNETVVVEVFGKKVNLTTARVCWLVQTGDWPKHTIDHTDRDSTNNKWENLRDVTQSENNKNKSKYKKKILDESLNLWQVKNIERHQPTEMRDG